MVESTRMCFKDAEGLLAGLGTGSPSTDVTQWFTDRTLQRDGRD